MLSEFLSYKQLIKNKYYFRYLKLAKKILEENRIYDTKHHENHHILPESFGGSKYIAYTFREHYIAHLLLTKFTIGEDRRKMTFAVHTFFHFDRNRKLNIRQSSYMYQSHKRKYIEECKTRTGAKNGNHDKKEYKFKNIKNNDEFICTRTELKNIADDLSDYDINAIIRRYKSEVICDIKGWTIFIDSLGIFASDINRKKPKKRELVLCEHCNRSIDILNFAKWHGNKCKYSNII